MPYVLWLLQYESTVAAFAHCLLTTTWNLMCRPHDFIHVQVENIVRDANVTHVKFALTKTDQEGESTKEHHIHANPLMPEICAHLSLARYQAMHPPIQCGPLFPGKNKYNQFCKFLLQVVEEHADEIRQLGVNPGNIGIHSIRKGAAIFYPNGNIGRTNFAAGSTVYDYLQQ